MERVSDLCSDWVGGGPWLLLRAAVTGRAAMGGVEDRGGDGERQGREGLRTFASMGSCSDGNG